MAKTRSEIQAKYDKTNTRCYSLKLNLKTDEALVKKLDSVKSIQGYIKNLIRADVEKEVKQWNPYTKT